MRAVLLFSALFLGAPLARAGGEGPPAAADGSPGGVGDAQASPAATPAFIPVHFQIGTDDVERSLNLSIPSPTEAPGAPAPVLPPAPSRPNNLFGTWFDVLPALQHDGINPTIAFISDLAGNPSGGKRQGFTEADQLGVDFVFDLGRLYGLPGAKAEVSFGSRSGSSLTDLYIDNLFQVQQVFGGETFRFIDLLFEQSLCNDRWNVRIGRLVAGDEFLYSPLYTLFMQNGINGNPVGIEFDAPGFTTYPVASWGARFRYKPVDQIYVMTGFYDGNPNVALNEMNGFDFSLRGPLFWITEAGYTLNGRKGATGLVGHYKAGIWYNGGSFGEFAPLSAISSDQEQLAERVARRLRLDRQTAQTATTTTQGDWGCYALMDQVIWRRGGAQSKQKVTVFGAVQLAPEQSINQLPYYVDGGIVCNAPFPSRPLDYAGFELGCGTISTDLTHAQETDHQVAPAVSVQTYEAVLEWTYSIHAAPGVQVQPDLQYIINPGAGGRYPNALVVGVQLSINF